MVSMPTEMTDDGGSRGWGFVNGFHDDAGISKSFVNIDVGVHLAIDLSTTCDSAIEQSIFH
jgi:hypothetical protein